MVVGARARSGSHCGRCRRRVRGGDAVYPPLLYPLLAFLFGVGLAWQWQQLAESRKVRRLRPRLWALLLIGVCHGLLLWPGDVLSTYAIVGLCVVALAGASAKRLRRWAIAAYALAAIFYSAAGAMMWLWAGPPSLLPEVPSSFAQSALRVAPGDASRRISRTRTGADTGPDLWAHVLFGMGSALWCSGGLPPPRANRRHPVTTALACRWRHPARWGSILKSSPPAMVAGRRAAITTSVSR